jgi:hypothetical protein
MTTKKKGETKAQRQRFYQVQMAAITEAKHSGAYTDEEISQMMRDAWDSAYGDIDPSKDNQ